MAPNGFGTPHSCDFCRTLVLDLYRKDVDWWRGTPALIVEKEINEADLVDCQATKDWLDNVLRVKSRVCNRQKVKCFGDSSGDSLEFIIIFDCTIEDVQQAAAQGCDLCDLITFHGRAIITENTLLAVVIYSDRVRFGKPIIQHRFEKEFKIVVSGFASYDRNDPGNDLQLIAAAGKLVLSHNAYRNTS